MSLRGARSIIGGWPRIGTGIERVHFDSPAIVGLGTSWPLGRHDRAEHARGVGCPLDTNPCARRRTSRVWSALAAAPRFSTDVDGRLSGWGTSHSSRQQRQSALPHSSALWHLLPLLPWAKRAAPTPPRPRCFLVLTVRRSWLAPR